LDMLNMQQGELVSRLTSLHEAYDALYRELLGTRRRQDALVDFSVEMYKTLANMTGGSLPFAFPSHLLGREEHPPGIFVTSHDHQHPHHPSPSHSHHTASNPSHSPNYSQGMSYQLNGEGGSSSTLGYSSNPNNSPAGFAPSPHFNTAISTPLPPSPGTMTTGSGRGGDVMGLGLTTDEVNSFANFDPYSDHHHHHGGMVYQHQVRQPQLSINTAAPTTGFTSFGGGGTGHHGTPPVSSGTDGASPSPGTEYSDGSSSLGGVKREGR